MGRTKGNRVFGPCKLCLKPSELKASHIIPEFVWKPIYDEKHRFISVNTSKESRNRFTQKGIYEKMLCETCETRISKLEQYASQIMNYKIGRPTFDREKGILTFQSVDYAKFKLFQLSVLWRSSVASDSNFVQVKLGEHENLIREMILEGEPGKHYEFGCVMIGLISRAGIPMERVILPPLKHTKLGHVTYTFVFAGCQWNFVVSSHSNELREKGIFLEENGKLPVAIRDAEDIGLLKFIYNTFVEAGEIQGPKL